MYLLVKSDKTKVMFTQLQDSVRTQELVLIEQVIEIKCMIRPD